MEGAKATAIGGHMKTKTKEVLDLLRAITEGSDLRVGQAIVASTRKKNPFLFYLSNEDLLNYLRELEGRRDYRKGTQDHE